jgi:hypothetical protein
MLASLESNNPFSVQLHLIYLIDALNVISKKNNCPKLLSFIVINVCYLHTVLKVSVKEGTDSESSVTVRLYGPNTDLVIDRERELQVSV